MTRREVLTNLICAYIRTNNGLLGLNSNGNLNKVWLDLTDAICNVAPEDDI